MDLNNETEILKTLFTKENITFILSLIGSASAFFTFWNSRKRLKCHISDAGYNAERKILVLSLILENRSRIPISVTNISISINGSEKTFEPYPRYVSQYYHFHGRELVDQKFLYNAVFPIALSQLGAASAYLLLALSQEEFEKLPTQMNLIIRSTRGLEQKKQLKLTAIRLIDKSEIQHLELEQTHHTP